MHMHSYGWWKLRIITGRITVLLETDKSMPLNSNATRYPKRKEMHGKYS